MKPNLVRHPLPHAQLAQNKPLKKSRSFDSFLQESCEKSVSLKKELKLSKHAQKRLEERGVELTETDLQTLDVAVSQMQKKGAQQSLLLYEDLALITSIHSRTVITALKASDFTTVTNIDSAMVVEKG